MGVISSGGAPQEAARLGGAAAAWAGVITSGASAGLSGACQEAVRLGGVAAAWAHGVITSGVTISGGMEGITSGASGLAASGARERARLGGVAATWAGVITSGASGGAAGGASLCRAAAGGVAAALAPLLQGCNTAAADALLRLSGLRLRLYHTSLEAAYAALGRFRGAGA